jgi:hypothetical protein
MAHLVRLFTAQQRGFSVIFNGHVKLPEGSWCLIYESNHTENAGFYI